MLRAFSRALALALLVLTSFACSIARDFTVADAAVKGFHDHLDRGEFAAIYADSAKEMKSVMIQ